jgi:hypothetical protein
VAAYQHRQAQFDWVVKQRIMAVDLRVAQPTHAVVVDCHFDHYRCIRNYNLGGKTRHLQ